MLHLYLCILCIVACLVGIVALSVKVVYDAEKFAQFGTLRRQNKKQ